MYCRRIGYLWPLILAGISACSWPDLGTDECSETTGVEATFLEAADGRAYLAANWYSNVGQCRGGRIGSAIYDVTLATGDVTSVTLPTGTRMGTLTESELIVIAIPEGSEQAGDRGPAFVAPIGDISAFAEANIRAIAVASTGGRAYFVTSYDIDKLRIWGPDPGEALSIVLEDAPRDLAVAFGRVWLANESGSVAEYDSVTLEWLHTEAACPLLGQIAAIADRVFAPCYASGIVALSGAGGNVVATLATDAQITFLDGRAGDPFGFASYEGDSGSQATRILFPDAGLIGEENSFYSRGFALSSSLALVQHPSDGGGGVYQVEVPEGSSRFLGRGSRFASLPDGTIVITRGDPGDLFLELVRMDPVTGEEIGEAISLPEPDSYYDED